MRAPLLATTVELALASLFYRYLFTQRMAGNLQKPNLLSGGAVARPMPPSCALTNKRSAYGVRKEGGECLMTRRSFGEDVAGSTRYTTCDACHAKVCVDCWDHIATKIDGIENGRRSVQPHDVWAAMKGRAYRRGCKERYRGFTPNADGGGGGRWDGGACPLCVSVTVDPPTPPIPRTRSGRSYADAPPKLIMQKTYLVQSASLTASGTMGPVLLHSVEFCLFEQLVDDDEARRCFKHMPAQGKYRLYWEAPRRLPGSNGLNIRVLAGKPADGSALVLLSAVAFDALEGCLDNQRSPTLDSTAQIARVLALHHDKRHKGERRCTGTNVVSHRATSAPAPAASATSATAPAASAADMDDQAAAALTAAAHMDDQAAATIPAAHAGKRKRKAQDTRQPGIWESTFMCMRVGGAYGTLFNVGGTTAVSKHRLCSSRCNARLPRGEANTVAVPILKEGHLVGLCPIWMSPDEYAAAALPGAAQAPISGADVSGRSLKEMMLLTDAGSRDAINVIARMTCVKVSVAMILGQLASDHPAEAAVAQTACFDTLMRWRACSSGDLAVGAGRPETRSTSVNARHDAQREAQREAPTGSAALTQFLGLHHATLGGWVGGHVDHMGDGLEDKIALAAVLVASSPTR
jgi:hypothetical protein